MPGASYPAHSIDAPLNELGFCNHCTTDYSWPPFLPKGWVPPPAQNVEPILFNDFHGDTRCGTLEMAWEYLKCVPGQRADPSINTFTDCLKQWLYYGVPPEPGRIIYYDATLRYRMGVQWSATYWTEALGLEMDTSCPKTDTDAGLEAFLLEVFGSTVPKAKADLSEAERAELTAIQKAKNVKRADLRLITEEVMKWPFFAFLPLPEFDGREFTKGYDYLALIFLRNGFKARDVAQRLAPFFMGREGGTARSGLPRTELPLVTRASFPFFDSYEITPSSQVVAEVAPPTVSHNGPPSLGNHSAPVIPAFDDGAFLPNNNGWISTELQ